MLNKIKDIILHPITFITDLKVSEKIGNIIFHPKLLIISSLFITAFVYIYFAAIF